MLYNIVLASAIHRHESVVVRYLSTLSRTSLPPPSSSSSSGLLQNTGLELTVSYGTSPPAVYSYVWWSVCFNYSLSMCPLPSHPAWVHKSVHYVYISIAALQIGSSGSSFQIPYICINIQYLFFSFWHISLYIIGSRFIHLIRVDANVFPFMAK